MWITFYDLWKKTYVCGQIQRKVCILCGFSSLFSVFFLILM